MPYFFLRWRLISSRYLIIKSDCSNFELNFELDNRLESTKTLFSLWRRLFVYQRYYML